MHKRVLAFREFNDRCIIPESHDDEEEEGGGSHDTDEHASSQTEDDDFDVLNWWKRKERMFSVLAKMAKQVLSMPVSTVAVEQEFSSTDNVLTQCRTRLSAESLEMLICYHDWLKA
ncbi:unnamed protein product, partial [Cuscuta europaea]